MKIKNIIIATLAVFTVVGCTENFDELVKDPVALSPNPAGQLTFTQLCLSGDGYYQHRTNLIYAGGFVQHYSGSWAVTEYGSKFKRVDEYATALWRNAYANEIKSVVDIIDKTSGDETAVNMNAVAKIMRVMIAHRLTDIYGDVPYSEAGMAFSKGIITPKYDKQQDIYAAFFSELQEAYAQLNANGGAIKGDLFYNGDVSKWKKLANTLRLRLAMRISEVTPAEAEKQAKAALQNGVFESNADNCIMRHLDFPFNDNPATLDFRGNGLSYGYISDEHGDHFSSLLIDYLRDNGDPRLTMIATPKMGSVNWGPVAPGEKLYEGIRPGTFRWDIPGGSNAASGIQPYLKLRTTPFLHVSYSETQLLLAEAAFRGWVSGSAADYYKKGVEAGVKQLEIYGAAPASQASIDTYVNANPLVAGTEMEQIGTQIWVTYLFNSIEAYSNWRRTGYPHLLPITNPDNGNGGKTPTRLYYPNDEMQKNEANYLDAVARLGGTNDWNGKVWWDVN
ncbi:SusD/RagB family nutrient-binding outer membrane lipoprotein [Flavobacterium sp. GA093]|uniref:SusD/RagB family nutrient-binding outer membrane lipoprotein n=1 Tax=Flavobacterium hydrocarbonoxydans TaxID=2683249 RepID=A0A6I4NPR3_9FLAO|nr:SusD/RagB family nutrient-binding outer membrane lipoprotein [Flavobacterium hydrocarbonoxydans]MWB93214.1 SusD/RagB family nutrient-binding outer membrane lipoprotein [Flavobacterium hydrocarbonoxydans]